MFSLGLASAFGDNVMVVNVMVVDGVKLGENNYKELVTFQYTYYPPDSLPLRTLLSAFA